MTKKVIKELFFFSGSALKHLLLRRQILWSFWNPLVSYHTLHRTIILLMMNDHGTGSQNEFLLRPHKRNTFNTSPERFITVIKVLFSNIPPQRSLLAMIPDIQQKQKMAILALEVGGLPGFLFLLRWTSPAWIMNSNRLRSEKQIASFKHENDWAKGWQTQRSTFIKAVYTRHKSQLLDPLEKLLCYTYNLSLTCIYWKTNLSNGCQDRFNMSIITTE